MTEATHTPRAARDAPPYLRDVPALAQRFLAVFPRLEPRARSLALRLYALLAQGGAVRPEALAAAAGVPRSEVDALLAGWHGVYRAGEAIVGFWGLTPRERPPHVLRGAGRTLYAWCAWDTLFLPAVLGRRLEVSSRDPQSGEAVRLTVAPGGVEHVTPPEVVMCMLEPQEAMFADIVSSFCCHVHFFTSPASGAAWVATHPGIALMTLGEAFELGRLRNENLFGTALPVPAAERYP